MRLRDLALQISPDERLPMFRRLAAALVQAIREGRLQPGQALPGTRALAEQVGVNRNTVIAAIQELEAEGWVISEPNRGTFVLDREPGMEGAHAALRAALLPEPAPAPAAPGFDLPSRLQPLSALDGEALSLAEGLPDSALAPTEALAKGYQRALRRHGEALLQYGEPMGSAQLRLALREWLSERRGLRVEPEQILVTRGSRAAITLLSLALLKEGDAVCVEDPGHRAVWDTLQHCVPVRLLRVPVDGQGLDVDALEALLATERPRFLYLTPQRQFPTTVPLAPERRTRLLELAARHRLALIEDDHDSDYAFGETPQLPLASQDRNGQVVYMTSLSRLLAPGVRLGCLVGPAVLIDRLARVQRNLEWQGDRVVEWAVADLIRDGDLARHLRRARTAYEARMTFLVERLKQELDGALEVHPPAGGLALWMRIREGIDAEAWITAARIRGLILHAPRHFYLGDSSPFTRMGFANAPEPQLAIAVERLAMAFQDLRRHGG